VTPERAQLSRALSATQLFLIAFGAAIGVGWIVVVGDWLRLAGPLGTVIGFAAGALVLLLVGLCYAELAAALPVTGGEVAYCYATFGLETAFAIGWFLALGYVGVTAFEAISIGWVLGTLIPGIEGPTLAVVNGEPLRLGSVLLGVGGIWALVAINLRGVRRAAAVQAWFTWSRVVASVVFIGAGLAFGSVANLDPPFQRAAAGSILPGILAIFMMTPNWLGGFAFVPQMMEEKAPGTPARRAATTMLLSIALAALFYSLVVLASAMVVPWPTVTTMRFPAADVFRVGLGSELLPRIVLVAGFFGLVAVWNAVLLGASRILFALGRARIIHPNFAGVTPEGVPVMATVFVGVCCTLGLLLGRRALIPIVTVVSATQAAAYLLVSVAVIKLRRTRPGLDRPCRVPGGVPVAGLAALGSAAALALAVYEPYRAAGGVPLEWWLVIGWSVLGFFFWAGSRGVRRAVPEPERRVLILGAAGAERGEP